MDAQLEIRLCGGLFIQQNGQPIKGWASRKAEALLAYLACNQRPHPREVLADLLWDERGQAQATANLRVLLTSLRQHVPDAVSISRQFVLFNPKGGAWVDVVALEELLTPVFKQSPQQHLLPPRLVTQLEQGVMLYRGEFLAGFSLRDANGFETWANVERERLRLLVLQTLNALTAHYVASEQYAAGVPWAQQWAQMDPLSEEANYKLITLLAYSGQRKATLEHYTHYRAVLLEELGSEPSTETTKLYDRILNAEIGAAQATRPPRPLMSTVDFTPLPHNLPALLSSFIGRTTEVAQIRERLSNPACRLLTLIGIGGVGKTRLALAVAQTFVQASSHPLPTDMAQFSDGVYFVRLERITTLDRLPSAIAEALNFTFQGKDDPKAQLLAYLRAKKLLLVMDNFEHLYSDPLPVGEPINDSDPSDDASDYLLDILERAAGVKVLATSRERLNFQGEWLLEIKGLAYPQTDNALLDEQTFPAIELFVQRAQAIQPDFVAATQSKAIIQICQQVEGLPLAITLAAASVRAFTCQQIAYEIRHNLDFLAATMRNLPARHRSLKAVFEHSWALLSPPEQVAFQRLAVFEDNFSAEAAMQVARVGSSLLAALVHKSLLIQAQIKPDLAAMPMTTYYKMHRVLRQYGIEKLAETPSRLEELRSYHSEYYSDFIQRHEKKLQTIEVAQALRAISFELENIRTGWYYAIATTKLACLERSLSGLTSFYMLRGPLPEAQAALETALDKVRKLLADGETTQLQILLGRLLAEKAMFLNEHGLYDQAIHTAQESIALADRSQHVESKALGYFQWGAALQWQGNYTLAHQVVNQALTFAVAAELYAIQAACHRLVGRIWVYQGNYAVGRTHHEASVRIYHEIGDQLNELKAYNGLATVYLYAGDYLNAKWHYEQCLASYRDIGDRPAMSIALNNLGAVSFHVGAYETARAFYNECLAIKQDLGDRQGQALACANLCLVWHRLNEQAQALLYGQQAISLSQELGNRDTEAYAHACLGHVFGALQRVSEAIEHYQQALTLRRMLGQTNQAMEPLAGLAKTYLGQGDLIQAQACAEELLPQLNFNAFAGVVELLRVYLSCYWVLQAGQDARAMRVLTMAHQIIEERAAKLNDPALRRSFLENVVEHREIMAEYDKMTR